MNPKRWEKIPLPLRKGILLLPAAIAVMLSATCNSQTAWSFSPRLNLAGLADPGFPTWLYGGQLKRGEFSFVYQHGTKTNLLFRRFADSTNATLQKNKFEFRYHPYFYAKNTRQHFNLGHYYGFQYFSTEFSQSLRGQAYYNTQGTWIIADSGTLVKHINGLALTTGREIALGSSNVFLEVGIDVGVRFVETNALHVVNPRPDPYHRIIFFRPIFFEEGKRTTPHLAINFSILYRFPLSHDGATVPF